MTSTTIDLYDDTTERGTALAGRLRGTLFPVAAGLLGVALLIGLWSVVYAAGLFPQAVFPSVAAVARAGAGLWRQGALQADVLASMRRVLGGFLIGSAAGVLAGVFTARTRFGRFTLQPLLRLFAPVPTIALIPLAILWFGLGEQSKLFLVSIGVFVPVWINTHNGVSATPRDYLRVCRCLASSRWDTLTRVVLPEALPDIISGLRVGMATAFVLIVASELSGTTQGLGYQLYQAELFSRADVMICCLIVLGVLGALCDQVIYRASDRWIRWARTGQ